MNKTVRPYTLTEEIAHSVVHGLGTIIAVIAMVILVTISAMKSDWWAVVSTAIFGITMIMMYSASTVYHAVPDPDAKKWLKKLDHITIYYLIAGTYTPFLLVTLRGTMGWIMLGIVWGLAFLGTFLKLRAKNASGTKAWSIGLYLLMGWLIVFASNALILALPMRSLMFLALGGLFYTAGIIFYVWKSKKYTHAIWHLFVLAGSVSHFFAILYGVVLR